MRKSHSRIWPLSFLAIGILIQTLTSRIGSVSATTESSLVTTAPSRNVAQPVETMERPSKIRIVFSDLDGTLIHYPENDIPNQTQNEMENAMIRLPSSATGLRGVISSRTLTLCRDLRKAGTKLVLVSGMRTSTLLKRLPYLPKADAYCTEGGGRIFYPVKLITDGCYCCRPIEYSGAQPPDLEPFGLQEDLQWRDIMEKNDAAGRDGFIGNEVSGRQGKSVPLKERDGDLWRFANLLETDGFVLDTNSYSTCFRVNRKQQMNDIFETKFDALLDGSIPHPPNIARSTNLGCIDYYPISSGKKNCCSYIAKLWGVAMREEAVCICDDDNDIEMALDCAHAFIPAMSSDTMAAIVARNPEKFTRTFHSDLQSTKATEKALEIIHSKIMEFNNSV